MCGIVGYIGSQPALPLLVRGLQRLEYRGYDGAGLAVHDGTTLRTVKAVGKVKELTNKLKGMSLPGTVGLAHTRWTTHGSPYNEANVHPHSDPDGLVVLAHNGTIQNHIELREELRARGAKFSSETDTELVAHLLAERLAADPKEDSLDALASVLRRLRGTYGFVIMRTNAPTELLVACSGSPLVVGYGSNCTMVASDESPLIGTSPLAKRLRDGQYGRLTAGWFELRSLDGTHLDEAGYALDGTVQEAQKGGHPHFMLAEMLEQGDAVRRVLEGRLDAENGDAILPELDALEEYEVDACTSIQRAIVLGCGSSYYSGQLGEQYIEELVGIPVETEIASEFIYRRPPVGPDTLVIVVTQSGETMDTLLAMREAKRQGAFVLSIVNKHHTYIPHESDATVYTRTGPEVGVASTKAFLTQCVALLLVALRLARQGGMPAERGREIVAELAALPEAIDGMLARRGEATAVAEKHRAANDFLYLGRRTSVPAIMEGALKLKEISYANAQAYPAGEMKHGPLAMLHKEFPCVILIPRDSVYEKTLDNVSQLHSREFPLVILTTEGNHDLDHMTPDIIRLPAAGELITPLLAVIPLQFFAYASSLLRGIDPDYPRYLAKVNTTE